MNWRYVVSKIAWALLGGVVAHLMWSRGTGEPLWDLGNLLSTLAAIVTGLIGLLLIRRFMSAREGSSR